MTRKKILLVDDSSTVLLMERLILKDCGHELITASDGREAVERAIAERPDIIVMDLMMPEMDGLEACRCLRRHEATQAIPVVIVTTEGEGGQVKSGFASGCNEFITKPFDRSLLLSRLRRYLGE